MSLLSPTRLRVRLMLLVLLAIIPAAAGAECPAA